MKEHRFYRLWQTLVQRRPARHGRDVEADGERDLRPQIQAQPRVNLLFDGVVAGIANEQWQSAARKPNKDASMVGD